MPQDDLYYRPAVSTLDFESPERLSRVLVVGTANDSLRAQLQRLHGEVRETGSADAAEGLSAGCYTAYRRGEWHGLVVVGSTIAAPASARHGFTDDGPRRHLALARLVLAEEWEIARPLLRLSEIAVNDVVRIRGVDAPGRVRRVSPSPAGYRIEVAVDGEIRSVSEASVQRIDGDPRDPRRTSRACPDPARPDVTPADRCAR